MSGSLIIALVTQLTYITSAFAIGLSPVTILAGLYACINFAWWVTLTIELPIVLAQPFMPFESLVGYNFDAQQIAICKLEALPQVTASFRPP